MEDDMMDKVREKHGEDVIEENEELVMDVAMATAYAIGSNLEDLFDDLEEEMGEIEEYFAEE